MLNLLMPFLGTLASGAFGMAGAASNARATRLNNIANANMQNATNQMNMNMAAAANAQQNAQWKASFKQSQNMYKEQMAMANTQFATELAEAEKDRALQKEFAQNGVQWRVDDAKAAGLHPLAALGAQLASSSPISISGNVPSGSVPGPTQQNVATAVAPQSQADYSMGNAMSNFGQDLSRAMSAVGTEWQRQKEVERASSMLGLENQALQNKLLASQIAKTRGAAIGPSMPIASSRMAVRNMLSGQGNTPSNIVEIQPHKPIASYPGNSAIEPGEVTDVGFAATGSGYAPIASKDVKERIEDDIFSEVVWNVRNRLAPSLGMNLNPPGHVKVPGGSKWWFNPLMQQYEVIKKWTPPGKGREWFRVGN